MHLHFFFCISPIFPIFMLFPSISSLFLYIYVFFLPFPLFPYLWGRYACTSLCLAMCSLFSLFFSTYILFSAFFLFIPNFYGFPFLPSPPRQPHELLFQDHCQRRCTCVPGQGLTCHEHTCTEDESCEIREGVVGCINKSEKK